MKKVKIFICAALLAGMTSCNEFEPVFTGKYAEPGGEKLYTDEDFYGIEHKSIKDLKAMYEANGSMPLKITDDFYIKGQVVSSDEEGNFYKSFIIQDETTGIEIKAGLSGLYNEYKVGQWVYVLCKGLTLGDYEGYRQLGYEDYTFEYESAYISQRPLLNRHVKKGEIGEPVEPKVIDVEAMAQAVFVNGKVDKTKFSEYLEPYLGNYVTVDALTYAKLIFCLAYVDPDQNHKDTYNRIFLGSSYDSRNPKSEEDIKKAWGVKTWGMSENQFATYLEAGNFDSAVRASDSSQSVGKLRKEGKMKTSAYSVSQYFYFFEDKETIQDKKKLGVRTSGYSRFSDFELDPAIWNKEKKVTFTGIFSIYDGEYQLTLIDLSGVKINEPAQEPAPEN